MVVSASWTTNIAGSAAGGTGVMDGVAAATAAATSKFTIPHPPRGLVLESLAAKRLAQSTRRAKSPAFSSASRVGPPSPIPVDHGHRRLNKCLAKSTKRELFSTDGAERLASQAIAA